MTNNETLKKIAAALKLRRSDIQEIFDMGGHYMSFSQAGGYMTGPENKRHKPLPDDLFTSFLEGLILYSRGSKDEPHIAPRLVLNCILDMAERDNEEGLNYIVNCVEAAREAMLQAREDEAALEEQRQQDSNGQ